jgi:FKBP-type peptidyl-prolyl cis-trans isomerase FklB
MRLLISTFLISVLFISVQAQSSPLTNQTDSASYSLGIVFGATMENAGITEVNDQLFMQGISDALKGNTPSLSVEQANLFLNQFVASLNQKKAGANLVEGEKFLAENSKNKDVVTLPSGLQYKVVQEGEGKSPVDTSFVTVHYTGTLIDGKVFDSSVERGEPAQFPVNGVIPGWTEALKLMKPGAKWVLYVPAALAYGERGNQGIAPNSVLIFDVQLIAVE